MLWLVKFLKNAAVLTPVQVRIHPEIVDSFGSKVFRKEKVKCALSF